MAISLVFHIALLFFPLPSPETVEEDLETETIEGDEEAVDILSLSDITPPEPPPEQPQEEPPPEDPAPPPSGAVPPPPDPEQVEEAPLEIEEEDITPPEDDLLPPEAGGAFDAARQQALAGQGRQRLTGSEFGGLNEDPTFVAEYIQLYGLKGNVDPNCFFDRIDPQYGLTPVQGVIDTLTVARNPDFVPDTLCENGFCTNHIPVGDYCNAPLYELQDNGESQFFASISEMGSGGSSIVALWVADPRP
ncbi:MAG: hypothetical protein F6K42_14840 [Leptolyngbya sp. SIO1D8]|nr:hypothetical protein [Leptolyngbya sp. SIO1D8]